MKADVRLVDNKPVVVATAEPGEKPTVSPAAAAASPAASPARVFVQRRTTSIFRSPPKVLTPDDVLLMVGSFVGCSWWHVCRGREARWCLVS